MVALLNRNQTPVDMGGSPERIVRAAMSGSTND